MKCKPVGSKENVYIVEHWKSLLGTYLKACDFEEAEKIVKKILEADPSDTYANEVYEQIQDWKYMEIKNGVLLKYRGRSEHVVIPVGVKNQRSSIW